MDGGNPLKGTAVALGLVALLMIGAGLTIMLLAEPEEGSGWAGLLIRAGALVGAVALVLPTIRKPSLSALLVAGAGLLVVMARPGLVWAALIGWSVWAILGYQRSTSSRES